MNNRSAEMGRLAAESAKFAAALQGAYSRGAFTLDFVAIDGKSIVAFFNTIPYPSVQAGAHGKKGEAARVIGRLKAQGAEFVAGAEFPDPGDGPDTITYALLFAISGPIAELTKAFFEEIDTGMVE